MDRLKAISWSYKAYPVCLAHVPRSDGSFLAIAMRVAKSPKKRPCVKSQTNLIRNYLSQKSRSYRLSWSCSTRSF
jgi:hypothetical protein